MNIMTYPKAYQSAFRGACFVLIDVWASSGLDVGIYTSGTSRLLGVKRIYVTGMASVNAAPYVRSLISVEPLCGSEPGMVVSSGRAVDCSITASGLTSPAVYLTGGTEDVPTNTILSAVSEPVKIRPGERDEIAVVTGGNRALPEITFLYNGEEYKDESLADVSGNEMLVYVVDVDDIGARFSALTGADASEMTGFTITLRISVRSSEECVWRKYEVDRTPHKGRRLAWVNRYGAVDYYTFPYSSGVRIAGSRERIYTSDGYRTVATAAETSETLLSEQLDPDTVEWLSEIFSSPSVWAVNGKSSEKVEVGSGSSEYSSARSGVVSVTVGPSEKPVSRKS